MSVSFKRFIQIAGVKDADEANMLVNCGVKYIGFPLELAVHKQDLSESLTNYINKPNNYNDANKYSAHNETENSNSSSLRHHIPQQRRDRKGTL